MCCAIVPVCGDSHVDQLCSCHENAGGGEEVVPCVFMNEETDDEKGKGGDHEHEGKHGFFAPVVLTEDHEKAEGHSEQEDHPFVTVREGQEAAKSGCEHGNEGQGEAVNGAGKTEDGSPAGALVFQRCLFFLQKLRFLSFSAILLQI